MPAQQHHYVPQFHLRQWGLTDRGPIGVLDKSNGRIFKANPRDVGGEKFFHSKLPEAQVIEDWFADLEAKASKLFAKIADRTDLAAINRHERLDL